MSKTALAFCITHTSAFGHLTHLTPFALQTAFPFSDYYGVSVPMRLAPVRESRVSCVVDVQVGLGAPVRTLKTAIGCPASSERVSMSKSFGIEFGLRTCCSAFPGSPGCLTAV